jgi:uncharacterized membrane-anchored protein
MKSIHLPTLGPRYWTALCLASICGANMGDFFAHDLGLGHVAGLPFLAAALLAVLLAERFDSLRHEVYYWTALSSCAQPRRLSRTSRQAISSCRGSAVLTVLLIAAVWASWHFAWRRETDKSDAVLRADLGYWVCMFLAGTLGTEAGDYSSHNLKLGDAGAALLLSPMVALMLGRGGRLLLLPVYWTTVVMIRAAGTAVGDFLAGRHMLGLPLSTLLTGLVLIAVLVVWKVPAAPDQDRTLRRPSMTARR